MRALRVCLVVALKVASSAASSPPIFSLSACANTAGAELAALSPGDTFMFGLEALSVSREVSRVLATCASRRAPSTCASAAGRAAFRIISLAWAEVEVFGEAESASSSAAASRFHVAAEDTNSLAAAAGGGGRDRSTAASASLWFLGLWLDPWNVCGTVARAAEAAVADSLRWLPVVMRGRSTSSVQSSQLRLALSPFFPVFAPSDDFRRLHAKMPAEVGTLPADGVSPVVVKLRCSLTRVALKYPLALAAGWALYAGAPALSASSPLYYGTGFSLGAVLALALAAMLLFRLRRSPAIILSGFAAATYAAFRQAVASLGTGSSNAATDLGASLWAHWRLLAVGYVLTAGAAVVLTQYVRGPIVNPRALAVIAAALRCIALAVLVLGASASTELAFAAAVAAVLMGSGGCAVAATVASDAGLVLVDSVPCLACCAARCAARRRLTGSAPSSFASALFSSQQPQLERLYCAQASSSIVDLPQPQPRAPSSASALHTGHFALSRSPVAASALSPDVAIALLDLEEQQLALQRRQLQLEQQRQLLLASPGVTISGGGGGERTTVHRRSGAAAERTTSPALIGLHSGSLFALSTGVDCTPALTPRQSPAATKRIVQCPSSVQSELAEGKLLLPSSDTTRARGGDMVVAPVSGTLNGSCVDDSDDVGSDDIDEDGSSEVKEVAASGKTADLMAVEDDGGCSGEEGDERAQGVVSGVAIEGNLSRAAKRARRV